MADIPFPRGVRDLLPNEALFRNDILQLIEVVFQLFGFLTIDTPSFESLDVLKAKNAIGSDTKLIYELKDEKLGLRYDHTMSLARYMVMHNDLPLPFKRYYIGKSWRREEPQKYRYREITQADADIVGGNKSMADAEIIGVGSTILENLGINYVVCVNDRSIMDKILAKFGVKEENSIDVMRILDKKEKVEEVKIVGMLKDLKLESSTVDQIMEFVAISGSNEEKLAYLDGLIGNAEATKDLKSTLSILKSYELKGAVQIDFSIMRGLDYYTGIVFEYKNSDDTSVSIGGGGRYDELIGKFGSKSLPAVGVSFGMDRILEMLEFSSSLEYTYARVFVANVNENNYPYAVKVANALRAKGIPTDVNMASRNLSKQFAYANAIKTKFVAVVGDSEEKMGKVKIRNLLSGSESVVSIDEAENIIKGE